MVVRVCFGEKFTGCFISSQRTAGVLMFSIKIKRSVLICWKKCFYIFYAGRVNQRDTRTDGNKEYLSLKREREREREIDHRRTSKEITMMNISAFCFC